MSAHRGWRAVASRGIAPRKVSFLLPGARAEGNAVGHRCSLQRPQGARLLSVGFGVGQVGRTHLLNLGFGPSAGTVLTVGNGNPRLVRA
jgi:hypothetical protein